MVRKILFFVFLAGILLCGGLGYAQEETTAREYDVGDMTSQTLTSKAWHAYNVKDFDAVIFYSDKCIELYKGKALVMQASMADFPPKGAEFDYWALNDVGTAYFILGSSFKEQGKNEESKEKFNILINDFPYAQCWDNRGWFWKPAEGAKDMLDLMELEEKTGERYDFGDNSSMTLTVNAWGALERKDYKGVELYTNRCIKLYGGEALKQQSELAEYLPKEQAFNAWALNDVGTCYYILGEADLAQSKFKEAKDAFSALIDKYSFSQCWDPRGWFWKPAVGARSKINKIIAEHGEEVE